MSLNNSTIKAYEAKVGKKYRLLPNSKRSRYLPVTCTKDGLSGKLEFEHRDDLKRMKRYLHNVDPFENLIVG